MSIEERMRAFQSADALLSSLLEGQRQVAELEPYELQRVVELAARYRHLVLARQAQEGVQSAVVLDTATFRPEAPCPLCLQPVRVDPPLPEQYAGAERGRQRLKVKGYVAIEYHSETGAVEPENRAALTPATLHAWCQERVNAVPGHGALVAKIIAVY